MSPERTHGRLSAALDAPPSNARVASGELDAALERLIRRRCDAAHAEGELRARNSAAGALEAACAQLERAREEAAAALARQSVELAVEIAGVLVRREIEAGRHALETIVRESLAASGVGRGACVVHLNPSDATMLAEVRFRAGTTIEADDAIPRGDVHVSTPHGLLVRETAEALRSIHDRLLGALA